jgi:hypothetical protein
MLAPGGWLTKLFLGFYDIIEEYLLRVIEESRVSNKMLETFDTTFIALIPKIYNPSSFEGFIPIPLCKCIYNIV